MDVPFLAQAQENRSERLTAPKNGVSAAYPMALQTNSSRCIDLSQASGRPRERRPEPAHAPAGRVSRMLTRSRRVRRLAGIPGQGHARRAAG